MGMPGSACHGLPLRTRGCWPPVAYQHVPVKATVAQGRKMGICSCPGPKGASCHPLLGCLITKVNRGPSALPHHSTCIDRLSSRPESWLPHSTPPRLSTDHCVSEQPTTQPTRPPKCWGSHAAYRRAEPCHPFGLTASSCNSKVKSGCFLTQLRARCKVRKGEELESWGHPLARDRSMRYDLLPWGLLK